MEKKDYNALLKEFRAKKQAEDKALEAETQRRRQGSTILDRQKKDELLPCLRRATGEDYLGWLRGFLAQGGMPSHNYDYPIAREPFYVAQKDFSLLPLYGAAALHIIVPHAYNCWGTDPGHCAVFLHAGYQTARGWIPIYDDLEF